MSSILRRLLHTDRGLPLVRIWDDLESYKKIFVAQGFYELSRKYVVRLEFVPYDYFQRAGAPAPLGPPCNSHRNIVILELTLQGKRARIAYDTNDLYYKVPNGILRWVDLYFKSNYQEAYLRTGQLLQDEYWRELTFRPECLPEPLDRSQSAKVRPCSFTMHLFPELDRNRRFLRKWAGRWLRTPCGKKPHAVFYLGRWWPDARLQPDVRLTQSLFDQIREHKVRLYGGIVQVGAELPEPYRPYLHPEVSLEEWTAMCCRSRVSLMTRGLDGCASFKALNYLMLGSPFIAMEMKANLWKPLMPDLHYLRIKDDASDLADLLARCEPPLLAEMGRRNCEHWRSYISPEATARYIIEQVLQVV